LILPRILVGSYGICYLWFASINTMCDYSTWVLLWGLIS
jgi:hypothetical protein